LTETPVSCELKDRILTITLSRPEKLNAFNDAMAAALIEAFDRADADDEVRAVIVTGAGRAFCAGADLSAGGKSFDYQALDADRGAASAAVDAEGRIDWSHPSVRDSGGTVTLRIFECLKPVIGAVNGAAVGIGATMLLPMDIRLASDPARFGFVFTRRGIVPEACSSWFLPRIVGISTALEWTMTGRLLSSQEALAGGLVSAVHSADGLLDASRAIAHEIVGNTAPVSVALTRQMMWRMLGADHPMEAHRIDSRGVYARGRSADAREGVSSFLEKRAARFTGTVSADMPEFFPWWSPRPYR
jgi:enoyl-CoA hydratase/carnithine racemase